MFLVLEIVRCQNLDKKAVVVLKVFKMSIILESILELFQSDRILILYEPLDLTFKDVNTHPVEGEAVFETLEPI